jgi:hypothetical protein
MKSSFTWDILITTIPHRRLGLIELLREFDRQLSGHPTVGVRVYYDNLQTPYGDKTQALINSSSADYVSSFDDDDWPAPDFVNSVLAAVWTYTTLHDAQFPDYVGFKVKWTQDGNPKLPVEHRLAHGGWYDENDLLKRDIAQFNPMRREVALTGRWEGGWEAERTWGNMVRNAGQCKTEAWIDEELYWYQERTENCFRSPRQPWDEPLPSLPDYPWLTKIGSHQ